MLLSDITESSRFVGQWLTLESGLERNRAVGFLGGVALRSRVFNLP